MGIVNYLPRRLKSSSAIIGIVCIFLIVGANLLLYHLSDNDVKSIYNSKLSSKTQNFQSTVDSVDSEEFLKSLLDEMKGAKERELLEKVMEELKVKHEASLLEELKKNIKDTNAEKFMNELRQSISKLNSDRFLDELKENIKKTQSDTILKELRKEITNNLDDEFTREVFQGRKISSTLLNELVNDFKITNLEDIKKYATSDLIKGLKNKLPGISEEDFNRAVEEEVNLKLDKKSYYQYLLKDILIANRPMVTLTKDNKGRSIQAGRYQHIRRLSRKSLSEGHFNLNDEQLLDFKTKHENLVKNLMLLDDPPVDFVSGKGIVISGGGSYFVGALVAIAQLRQSGSKLPIELIMNSKDEYDAQICEELLPTKFNARCLIIEEEIGKDVVDLLNFDLSGSQKFQMKVLGLMVSSFDHIIAIDADNMALKNVDDYLNSEPYLSTKWVMWPDIWMKATSPLFYDIIGIELGEPTGRRCIANDWNFFEYIQKDRNNDICIHDFEGSPHFRSIESGQMIFSKRAHFKAYLLALYYNIYGYSHFYDMIYQGTPGSGDKDTFLPALHTLKESYHVVDYDVWLAGYMTENYFQETTIVQYDPIQALELEKAWKKWLASKNLDTRLFVFQDNSWTHDMVEQFKKDKKEGQKDSGELKWADVAFLHVHKPKINPIGLGTNYGIYSRRNLGLPGTYNEHFGDRDWELQFHSISKWVVCEGITSESWWRDQAKENRADICKQVSDYVEFLKKDSTDLDAANVELWRK